MPRDRLIVVIASGSATLILRCLIPLPTRAVQDLQHQHAGLPLAARGGTVIALTGLERRPRLRRPIWPARCAIRRARPLLPVIAAPAVAAGAGLTVLGALRH